ncbi:MAG: gamma-glutamyltransferase family protein [Parvibaculaceae bacterium]|jgi:gamma-glutamyltranspeptidase/glutathione hydrolase|nr:gamma-glutamyltransferase family protein [Parvibaculaceae bacterium]HBM89211.1 gamma-glutamyltransferase family protein [Rhodobiaceae bacterium]
MRDMHYPGRSTVHAMNGMCATSQPLAAEAAVNLLRQGGNAVDAAICASAVLCVVEPYNTGIGGDCFALLSKGGSGEVIGLNGSGRAPKNASAQKLRDQGISEIGLTSVHSATIPGAVDAWDRLLKDHGSMGFAEVLAPAIRIAEEGFPASPRVSLEWRYLADHLKKDPDAAAHFLANGAGPEVGQVVRMPGLAATLRLIAEKGRAGFYEGEVAEDLVTKLKSLGGEHTLDDFASTCADYVTPTRTDYRGRQVLEIPPNGQGITAQIALNVLGHFDLGSVDPHGPERFHLEMEACRLAYDLRDKYVADPEFAAVPVDDLLSAKTAATLADRIDPNRALKDVVANRDPLNRDTIYLTVVDQDRNAISFINSLYQAFGSGITGPTSAVVMQNRGAGFVLTEGHPNCLEGGKRPLHTIIPGMLVEEGRATLPFGVMGGAFQPVGHVHLMTNFIDFGMDVQEALDSPRAFPGARSIEVEKGIDGAVRAGLEARGHAVSNALLPLGGGQAIYLDPVYGGLIGGSDPRKDGAAIGY